MRVFFACLLLVGLSAPAFAETLEVSGSTVVVKDIVQPAAAALKDATGVELKTAYMSSGRGMQALFEGKAAMAAISEPLEDATASARKEMADTGSKVAIPPNLQFHEIGRDRVAVFLHKDNAIASLSKGQLKDIFSGKVRNWKEVGGPDVPVKIYLATVGSGTRATFQKLALDNAPYGAGAEEFRTSLAAIVAVSKDRGGIAVAGPSLIEDAKSPSLRIVATPPIERPVGLVTIGKPSEPAQKVIDFLRKRK